MKKYLVQFGKFRRGYTLEAGSPEEAAHITIKDQMFMKDTEYDINVIELNNVKVFKINGDYELIEKK